MTLLSVLQKKKKSTKGYRSNFMLTDKWHEQMFRRLTFKDKWTKERKWLHLKTNLTAHKGISHHTHKSQRLDGFTTNSTKW